MAMIQIFLICFLLYTDFVTPQETDTQTNINKIIEGVRGLWNDFTRRFSNKYKSIQDFSANSKQELLSKINDTQQYLALAVKHRQEMLRQTTDETRQSAQRALDQANGWLNEVTAFKTRVIESTDAEFANLKQEWIQYITRFWNGGLDRIIEMGKNLRIGSGK